MGLVVATAASEAMLAVVLVVAALVLGAVWVETPLVGPPVVALASGAVLASGLVVAMASQVVSVEALEQVAAVAAV